MGVQLPRKPKVIDFFVSALRRKLDSVGVGSGRCAASATRSGRELPRTARARVLAGWRCLSSPPRRPPTSSIQLWATPAARRGAARAAATAARGRARPARGARGPHLADGPPGPWSHAFQLPGARDATSGDAAPSHAPSGAKRRGPKGESRSCVRNRKSSSLSTLLRTLLAVGCGSSSRRASRRRPRGRALRPVERMREEADDLGAELDRRIAEGRPDELGRLARAFNRLLARAHGRRPSSITCRRRIARAPHARHRPAGSRPDRCARIDRADLDRRASPPRSLLPRSRTRAHAPELLSLQRRRAGRPLEPVRLDVTAGMRATRCARSTTGAELALAGHVPGEEGRLGELIRILVDNALKYSPSDEIVEVSVDAGGPARRARPRPRSLRDDRERALDRFYRGSASRRRGSGLGLAIARAVCERHGAELELQAAPGGGTVATVWLAPR